MLIVFVHGVNTRKGSAYDAGVNVPKGYLEDCETEALGTLAGADLRALLAHMDWRDVTN